MTRELCFYMHICMCLYVRPPTPRKHVFFNTGRPACPWSQVATGLVWTKRTRIQLRWQTPLRSVFPRAGSGVPGGFRRNTNTFDWYKVGDADTSRYPGTSCRCRRLKCLKLMDMMDSSTHPIAPSMGHSFWMILDDFGAWHISRSHLPRRSPTGSNLTRSKQSYHIIPTYPYKYITNTNTIPQSYCRLSAKNHVRSRLMKVAEAPLHSDTTTTEIHGTWWN